MLPLALLALTVATSDTFTEGPVFDSAGNIYFSNRTSILKLAPDGQLSTWLHDPGAGFNGHKILPDGTHLICAAKRSAVLRYSQDARPLGAASTECEGKPLRAPNDITLDPRGGFWFTDPGGSREAPIGTVHYVGIDGVTRLAAGGMRVPNGLVLTHDNKFLYVSETVPNRILRFPVVAPGKLGPMEIFATLPSRVGHAAEPDGLTLDKSGNLYVAHLGTGSVRVFNPQGRLIRTHPAGVYDASNLVFGGPGYNQLFITGSTGHRSTTPGRLMRLDLDPVSR